MKTLADLKRRVQPGVKLLALEHWQPKHIGVVRTVTRIQGNGYYYVIPGDEREMWSNYGKSSEFTFPTVNSYRYESAGKGWTLEFVEAA